MTKPVDIIEFHAEQTSSFAPFVLDRRSRATNLAELSAGFLVSEKGGRGEPWTLAYDEVLYGIEGTVTVHVEGQDPVVIRPGDFATLARGTTVVYEASPGSRALYAVAPANWAEQVPEAWAAAQTWEASPRAED